MSPHLGAARERPLRGGSAAPGRSDSVISCQRLTVGYNGTPVLEDLSFTIAAGSTIGIVGRSGCGKTTLLRTLCGIIDPLEGEATVLGSHLPRAPEAGTLGYIPQSLGLVSHGTVLRNVLHGTLPQLGWTRSLLGRFPPNAKRDARSVIAKVGLTGMEDQRINHLSGGQRRRVAIARAFVQRPEVLLADEMLSELDMETAESIISCLDGLQAETGMTVVLVEHNLDMARQLADRILRVEHGTIGELDEPLQHDRFSG